MALFDAECSETHYLSYWSWTESKRWTRRKNWASRKRFGYCVFKIVGKFVFRFVFISRRVKYCWTSYRWTSWHQKRTAKRIRWCHLRGNNPNWSRTSRSRSCRRSYHRSYQSNQRRNHWSHWGASKPRGNQHCKGCPGCSRRSCCWQSRNWNWVKYVHLALNLSSVIQVWTDF